MLVSGSCLDVCGCCTSVTLRVDGFVIVCDWFGVVLRVVLLLSACFVGVIGLIWLLVLRRWWAGICGGFTFKCWWVLLWLCCC